MAEKQQCMFNREELRKRLEARGIKGELLDFILSKYPKDYRCKREAYKDGMCIFHSEEKPENFEELFWQEFKRMEREEGEIDFTGAIFPEMRFSSIEKPLKAERPINFSGASFQEAVFESAEFRWASFNGAKFKLANFIGAKFQEVGFIGAEFELALFISGKFQEAEFSGAKFQDATFKDAKFGDAYFQGARFRGDITFRRAEFESADFNNAEFRQVVFYDTKFQEATFKNAKFGDAYFQGAEFQLVDFNNAEFQAADFSSAKFQDVEFISAKFKGNANFQFAKFRQRANFENAEFHQLANFNGTKFQEAEFYDTKFQEAEFSCAEFQVAIFKNAKFESANFQGVKFQEAILEFALRKNQSPCIANFEFAEFESYLSLKLLGGDGVLLLHMAEFKDPRKVIIVVPLSAVSFLQTDLTDVTLIPSERSKKSSDERILDEKLWEYHRMTQGKDKSKSKEEKEVSEQKGNTLGIIGKFRMFMSRITGKEDVSLSGSEKKAYEILKGRLSRELIIAEYKNIRKCLEANRMFTEASPLFIREMRLARSRLSWWNFPEKIAHYLFDGIARYGESIGWPIFWSFLVILLSSLYLAWIRGNMSFTLALSWIISHPLEAISSLLGIMGIVTSVFFQMRSLGDFFNEMYREQLLPLEIFIRLSSIVLLGSLYIALRRRLERK